MGKAMQEQVYQDHTRTVNKVNFHASEPNKLISGSQDGTVRYFDIRVKNAVSVFYRLVFLKKFFMFFGVLTNTKKNLVLKI